MELSQATRIANEVKQILAPHCSRIEIAGSIRRRKPFVHDIDIVAIPANQGAFITALSSLGKIKVGGQKLIRCDYNGVSLDVYIASPETWATLLLIRTGSKESNIRLCSLALRKGMKLHADGSGLFNSDALRIAGDTEQSIFEALGIPYLKPEARN